MCWNKTIFRADETKWVYFGLFAAVLALTLPIVLPVFLLELRPLVQQGGARVSWQWLWPVPVLFNIVFHVKFYSGNFTAKLMDIRQTLARRCFGWWPRLRPVC